MAAMLVVLGGSAGDDPVAKTGAQKALAKARAEALREGLPTNADEAAERFLDERVPPGKKEIPAGLYDAARERMRGMLRYSTVTGELVSYEPDAREKAGLAWSELGPGNIGGRTRALVIDPKDPRIFYAAGASGGVWKSTDAGANWRWVADDFANLTVVSLAMDPADSRVLYAGTGEGILTNVARGMGIYRTADGGETWQHLAATSTADFHFVNDLVISRADPRRLYAATRTGVWRSLDRGATWRRVLDPKTGSGCEDLAIRTDRPVDVVLAACGRREQASVWRNVRANAPKGRWQKVLTEPAMNRTSLAIAPSNQDIIYALSSSGTAYPQNPTDSYQDNLHAVFRSTNGGATWEARVRNTDPVELNTLLLSYVLIANGSDCGLQPVEYDNALGQGWYANTIAVDPANPDRVWAGGIDLFRSDDGGRNWGLATYWWAFGADAAPSYVHADQHVLVFHPRYNGTTNRILYAGNDGGVFRTRDALAATAKGAKAGCDPERSLLQWQSLSRDYGTIQFYHGVAYADGTRYLGGTQDNGTPLGGDATGRNGWKMVLGGDGDWVAADPANPNILYAQIFGGGALQKSTDGGVTFESMASAEGWSDFRGPFLIDPQQGARLWYAGSRVWRSEDRAESFTAASFKFNDLPTLGLAEALAVSPVDSNRVLVGTRQGAILRSSAALSTTGETPWDFVRLRENAQVSWLAFDPKDANVAYATYSNFGGPHVFKTTDGGVTWTSIDGAGAGALPDIPVHTILVDPTKTGRLYIGTDLGVFVSLNGGATWAVETGFSPVITQTLQALKRSNGETLLFAFTYGRGAWKVKLGS
ncbi:MAG TPA: hypothetical protein VJ725_31140 [Thermoanaerobaculia bacterium]|nr:hypothetical protein [Thermoanaerobaculia bacterium]